MSNTILIKRSGTANAIPSSANLSLGELAINYTDGNLFYKDAGGTVKVIASNQTFTLSGNISAGNISTGGLITATGNIKGGNINTANIVSAGGNVIAGNINTTGIANIGKLTVTGTTNLGNVGNVTITGGSNGYLLTTDGTGNLTWTATASTNTIFNGTSNVSIPTANGNIYINANAAVDYQWVFGTDGNLTAPATGTANLGNLAIANNFSTNGTGGDITLTSGNILGGNVVFANSFTSNGGLVDFNTNNANVQLGSNANVHLYGGSNGQVLQTDGAGNLNWYSISATEIVNGTSNVSIPVANGNIYINANAAVDQQWAFGTDGTLYFPLVNGQVSIQQQRYGMGNLVGYLDGGWVLGEYNGTAYGTEGIRISPGIEGNVEVILPSDANAATQPLALNNYSTGNVLIESNGHYWNFDNAGNTQFPSIGTANLGNLVTANYASFTNNLNVGGNIVTGTGSGGNITGVNYLVSNVVNSGSISATGNAIIGNISSAGNITGANVVAITAVDTGNINHATAISITASTGNINLSPVSGNIVLANSYINGVAYPAQDQDAASKIYVDNMSSTGLAYHPPVLAATISNLAVATGGTISYTQPNGAGNGVGALLTTTGNFYLIDTSNVQTVGTRILVKNEDNAAYNGVYTWANATNIIRSTDTDEYGPNSIEQLSLNDYFFVQAGNVNAGSAYVVSAPVGTITFGTSNIKFSQFSSSQTYSANTAAGLVLVNQTFNAKVDNNTTAFDGGGNISVKASANLTTPNIGAATGTRLSLSGNVVAGNLDAGSGVIVTTGNITGGNVLFGTGRVSGTGNVTAGNISTAGLANVANLVVYTFANVTSTTASNDTTSGALRVAGGVGVVGNIYAGGMYVGTDSVLTINSTVDGGTY
jgi:hypothetical protein